MEENKTENVIKEPKKKTKKIAIIVILLVVIISAISTAVYFIFFAKKEIDLSKYLTVEYTGYDGYASATVKINEEELENELDDASLAKKFVEKAEIEIKNNSNLANGDELKIKVSLSSSWLENNKLELKDKTIKIPVKDLDETKTVDIFEDVEIETTGISPEIQISVNCNSSDKFIRKITFSASPKSNLKNGDVVTITANYNKSDAMEAGITPESDTMEYTVKGKPTYVSNLDEINASIKESVTNGLLDKVKTEITNNATKAIIYGYKTNNYDEKFTNTEPELVNIYLLTPKTSSKYASTLNSVYAIYKTTFTSETTAQTYEWYYTVHMDNIAIKSKKLYEEKENKCTVSTYWDYDYSLKSEDAYEHYIDSQKSNFVIEEIK